MYTVRSPSEAQVAAIIEISADAVLMLDREQRITLFNEGAERIFGYAREEVLGRSLEMLLPEGFRAAHHHHIEAFTRSGVRARRMGERDEIRGLRRGGEEFPAEASISMIETEEDLILTVVLRDVSDRKRIESELAERERQLAEAQRIAHLGSWEWDVVGNRVRWSDELYRIYGLEPGSVELSLETFLERVHPEDREGTMRQVGRALETGEPFHYDERVVRPDGEVRQLRTTGQVVIDASGRTLRLIGVCQDVTEQRAAEQQANELLREQTSRAAAEEAARHMRFLADASAELASSLDSSTTLRTVARLAVPVMADWCAVDLLGDDGRLRRLAVEHPDPERVRLAQELDERYPPRTDVPFGVHHVLRTGQAELAYDLPDTLLVQAARDEEHLRILRELGLRSYVTAPLLTRGRTLGALTVVYAESGRRYVEEDRQLIEDLARRAAVAIDNSRLVRELEEVRDRLALQSSTLEIQNEELQTQALELEETSVQLREAMQSAEQANAGKSQFLAMMSHELRTPLNAIIGFTDLLVEEIVGPVSPRQREHLERVRGAAGHLLKLINQVLSLSRIEAGREEVLLERVEFGGLLREAAELIRPAIEKKGLLFRLVAPEGRTHLETDPDKLRQILLNLLGNAVKFTEPGGGIVLEAGLGEEEYFFTVRDTGPGIAGTHLERIFEPFEQVQTDRSGRVEGTGLGLAIVRRLAQLLGGEIGVESEVGAGTAFTVRLPLAAAASARG